MATGGVPTEPLNDLSTFPRWTRRLFPEIELLADNPVYAAFAVRREQIKRHRRHQETPAWIIALGAGTLTIEIALTFLFGWELALFILVGIVLTGLCVRAIIAIRARRPNEVPPNFRQLFGHKDMHTEYYQDLWLAPITSRDILMMSAAEVYKEVVGNVAILAVSLASLPLYAIWRLHQISILSITVLALAVLPIVLISLPAWIRYRTMVPIGNLRKSHVTHLARMTGHAKAVERRGNHIQIKAGALVLAGYAVAIVIVFLINATVFKMTFDGQTIWEMMVGWSSATWQQIGWGILLSLEAIFCWNFWPVSRDSEQDFLERLDAASQSFDHLRALLVRALAGDTIDCEEFMAEVYGATEEAYKEYHIAARERVRRRRLHRRVFSLCRRLLPK
ncbi:hypothetical protein KQI84_08320 [bacterium]|nr:hypothetical protein [bacterium]